MFYIKDFFVRSLFALLGLLFLLAILYNNKAYLDFLLISPTLKTPFPIHYLIFTQITEGFLIYLESLLLLSKLFMLPYLLWLLVDYFKPALYAEEYETLNYLVALSFVTIPLFFFIFINQIYPYLWSFFSSFDHESRGISFFFEVRAFDYLTVFFNTLTVTYCVISVFVLGYFLSTSSKYTTPVFLLKQKKVIQLLFLAASTLLTPPDVYSQATSFFCFLFFFESLLYLYFVKEILFTELKRKPVKTN